MRFCNCGNPVFGTDKKTGIGYCKSCQWKRTDTDKRSIIQKAIAKNASKNETSKVRKLLTDNVNMEMINKKKEMDAWFNDRREEMKGMCVECGKNTNKNNDKYFRWSVCHIVPKALCPSVSTNENNWIELCIDHHTQFDSTFTKAAELKCFLTIRRKFKLFENLLPMEELRKVNPKLL